MRAAVYARSESCERPLAMAEILGQLGLAMKELAKRKYTVAGLYCDEGYPGNTLERPGLKDLLKGIRAGDVDRVIVRDYLCLADTEKATIRLRDVLQKHGVQVVQTEEPVFVGEDEEEE